MISLNVRTMTEVAKALKLNIEEQFNAHVWICTDMVGGMVYRDEIVKAVDKAYAVILLVNNDWAESAECEDEYNYAKRLNLTSKIEPRQPLLLPIAFPDLDWQKRGHVRLLMSSTNAIVVKEATVSSVWPQLKETLLTLNIPQAVFKKDGSIDFTKHISRDILLKFTCEQVLKWIDNHGLVPLRKHAEENFITGQDLVDLTPEDLEGFKIPPFQIKKILNALAEYKQVPKDYYRTPLNPNDPVIDAEIKFVIDRKTVQLFQHTATSLYITLSNTGSSDNFSSYIVPKRKPWGASDVDVYTRFSKIRFDPVSMTVNTGDFTYAKSVGKCGHHANVNITAQFPYATCFDCEHENSHSGKANINLVGTSFAVDDTFKHDGWCAAGTWEYSHSNQIVNLTGGGFCGWTTPTSSGDESSTIQGGWFLKLKLA